MKIKRIKELCPDISYLILLDALAQVPDKECPTSRGALASGEEVVVIMGDIHGLDLVLVTLESAYVSQTYHVP